MDLYSCWPPPLFMILMSVVQVLYHLHRHQLQF